MKLIYICLLYFYGGFGAFIFSRQKCRSRLLSHYTLIFGYLIVTDQIKGIRILRIKAIACMTSHKFLLTLQPSSLHLLCSCEKPLSSFGFLLGHLYRNASKLLLQAPHPMQTGIRTNFYSQQS